MHLYQISKHKSQIFLSNPQLLYMIRHAQVNLVPDTYYFFPIAQSVLDKNTKLQQNKDWGGTFDPTIQ